MSTEHDEGARSPDEFDRQLRDLYSGTAGVAKFREPSAAERARRAAKRSRHPGRQSGRRPTSWQKSPQARKLRRPVTSADAIGRRAAQGRWPRWLGPIGRITSRRRRPLSPGERRRRLRSLAKGAGILVGFVALLFLLHTLGFGPH
jgi:hypothetical protein